MSTEYWKSPRSFSFQFLDIFGESRPKVAPTEEESELGDPSYDKYENLHFKPFCYIIKV